MKKGFSLLKSIIRIRRLGLLKLKPVKRDTFFECQLDNCPLSCCWVFDKVQVEEDELSHINSTFLKKDGVHYLARKKHICIAGNSCIEFVNCRCNIYTSRPISCKEYPWYRFGNKVFYDSNCPGITKSGKTNQPGVNELLDSRRYFNALHLNLRRIVIWYITHL